MAIHLQIENGAKCGARSYYGYGIGTTNDLTHVNCKRCKGEVRRPDFSGIVNPFKVGDILDYSWGYDQTNVEFYQVVAVGKKSIKVRRIAARGVEGSGGVMSQSVIPVKDAFLEKSEVLTKRLYPAPYCEFGVRVPMDHGNLDKWDGRPMYSSWYA